MSFVSLEDDSSVDSESEFFLDTLKHPPPTHHHPIVEKHGKYSDIPSIEDVREDSPTWKASNFILQKKNQCFDSKTHFPWNLYFETIRILALL